MLQIQEKTMIIDYCPTCDLLTAGTKLASSASSRAKPSATI